MTIGLLIPATCLFFSVLLNIVYFSKNRLNNLENKLYKFIVVSNLVALVFEFLNTFSSQYPSTVLSFFVLKTYLLLLLVWVTVLAIYMICIAKKSHKLFVPFWMISIVLTTVITIILPFQFSTGKYGPTITGPAVDFIYAISMLYCVICICTFVIQLYKPNNRKLIPFFVYLVMGIFFSFVQKHNPGLLLITPVETFITFVMYFTIENPDLHMIQELNLAKDHAEKANKAKTDFLSNMSHEIRTPLNAIDGFSQVMLEETDIHTMKEEAYDIRMACQNLIELVNGILDISKIESNHIEIVNADYDSHQMLKEVTTLVSTRLGNKNIEFRTNFDESIPQILYGDVSRIKQILLNLLTNAVKYTKEGYIEFKVDAVIDKNRCRLIFSVEDSGVGIKTSDMDKLFNKFERLEMERQSTIEGTGLGLAITKSLVELMGGKILVQSKYGKGSKFTVSLDQEIKQTAVSTKTSLNDIQKSYKPNSTDEKVVNSEITFTDFSDCKILIVDDNNINLKVIDKLLKGYQPQVVLLKSGQECIDHMMNGETYDLIFMDDMMPRMSGVQTFHELEKIAGFHTPVVALTANAIEGMKEKYLNEGFQDYLSKPIDRKELDRILKQYLKKK